MKCVANFEVKTQCSVVADDLPLSIQHPRGLYRARIQNIPRDVYTKPFLLSLHLYFEAPALNEAEDIAEEHLSDCLNMLAFATGASFQRHRIRQIVDASEPGPGGMRSVLFWTDSIEYEDPQPFLSEDIKQAIERMLEFDFPPAVRRALRWYRIGVSETVPDDQFICFWFALEIVAEFQKSTEKVPSKCPHCHAPLYCEACGAHPVHKPYVKEAIRELLKAADQDCDDATIKMLDDTRNSLMHGSTLREIEKQLPEPHEHIVDVLGRLVWRALVLQFPRNTFDGSITVGYPSTYVHRKLSAFTVMDTLVPTHKNGDLDLRFKGFTAEIKPFGPPQSALPTVVKLTVEQHEQLGNHRFKKGPHQEICERIWSRVKPEGDDVLALVLATDLAEIMKVLEHGEVGEIQELFREIFGEKGGE